jgi:hypothetical protein
MTPFERWAVWLTSAATVVTGLVYLWMKYLLHSPDPFAVVNHPLQPLFLKLHILVAPLLVFTLGVILLRHVWRHYRAGMLWGRRSGIATALFAGPMILTGYLIQTITHEGWLQAMAWAHIGAGIVCAIGLVLHQVFVRKAIRGIRGVNEEIRT